MSRSRIGRSALALTIALVAALAAIGVLAWFVVRGDPARRTERADNPKLEVRSDPQADLSSDKTPLEARSAEQGEAGGGGTQGGEASTGSGTLRIRVLDELTRAPIPDLQLVAYRERGGTKELGRGRTDKDGRAELREVEANTVIVRTERKPPHAERTAAVWLVPGAVKELEILVGAGGAVAGRVVDDLRRPVAGAEIRYQRASGSVPGFPGRALQPDALSASDGSFRLENLASWPGAVWVVDGEMRPQAWNDVYFSAGLDGVWVSAKVLPVPGKVIEFGDLTLARATTYAGTVRDSSNRAIAGALLSRGSTREDARSGGSKQAPELAIGPGKPGFHELPSEVLTDESGGFEMRTDGTSPWITVWTPDNHLQSFQLPRGMPGDRVDGVLLKLDLFTCVELELVDREGVPACVPAHLAPQGELWAPWRSGNPLASTVLQVLTLSSEGKRSGAHAAHCESDRTWRVELQTDPARIAELTITASGYEPVIERSATGFPPLIRRRLELVEFPAFRVSVASNDARTALLDSPGAQLQLHVCLADPSRHARHLDCCGFGVYWTGSWRGEALALTLQVRRKGAFWIYACRPVPNRLPEDLAWIGPFEPGPDEHQLALDPSRLVVRAATQAEEPPPAKGAADDPMAKLAARILDARTHDAIPGATLDYTYLAPETNRSWGCAAKADGDGEIRGSPMYSGRWAFSAAAFHYERQELGDKQARAGETLDFGTILLEPASVHRGKLIAMGGGAPVGECGVSLLSASGQLDRILSAQVREDGSFEFAGSLPNAPMLQTSVELFGARRACEYQRFLLDPWPEDEVKEVHLVASRRVVVTVLGLEADESALVPYACVAPGEPTANCDHRLPTEPVHTALARGFALEPVSGTPRYGFQLAPGRYQISGANALHDLPVTELEMAPGESDFELTITAH